MLFCFRDKTKMLMPNGSPREKESIAMKSSSSVQLHATAFLYDHLNDFSVWIRKLTPEQLGNIARVMIARARHHRRTR